MVNVYRGIVLVNEGSRAGYVASLRVRATAPEAWDLGNEYLAGVADEHGMPRPDPDVRIEIEPGKRHDLTLAWWFDIRTAQVDLVRAAIRDPQGPLSAEIGYSSLESGLRGPTFKALARRIWPKLAADELVGWGTYAMSVGLDAAHRPRAVRESPPSGAAEGERSELSAEAGGAAANP